MWTTELIILLNRIKETIKNTEPIITCMPWNPVAIKKVEPKEESDMQKGASKYSKPWNKVKIKPSIIVKNKAISDLKKSPFSISWWAQVTLTPEDNKRTVFSNGILIGLKEITIKGGQSWPNSIVGEILLWKNAQKKDIKNRTSETIKRTIPIFNPFITASGCIPCQDLSRCTSRHHEKATINVTEKDNANVNKDTAFISKTNLNTKDMEAPAAKIGQGLTFTRWNELNLFIIILSLWCKV